MSRSNVAASTIMMDTKLYSLDIKLLDARYEKNEKEINLSVDDEVQWSYKWTNKFAPLLGLNFHMPISSTVEISLVDKHRVYHRLLGSYSGRVIEFLLDAERPLTLQHRLHGACATITMDLSPLVDYQQAWKHSFDMSLASQIMNYYVETCGQHIVPLGQALRLMDKLINNVPEEHPLLNLGWTLLSSAYTVIQQQQWEDPYVQSLAEFFRDVVGAAGDCRVAEIKGIIPSIERLALEIASLIAEFIKNRSMTRLDVAQIINRGPWWTWSINELRGGREIREASSYTAKNPLGGGNGMVPHYSGTTLDAHARYAGGTRSIVESYLTNKPQDAGNIIVGL
ncbi:hypothetical protein PAXINDRAFT_97128 [Paxillus involutus ATCC 200175]|nr:hypothetical protein PAXINDRAFT_97128 [Paxillus involutus ATCC 200175]